MCPAAETCARPGPQSFCRQHAREVRVKGDPLHIPLPAPVHKAFAGRIRDVEKLLPGPLHIPLLALVLKAFAGSIRERYESKVTRCTYLCLHRSTKRSRAAFEM